MTTEDACIAFDLGGTKLAAALVTQGRIRARRQIATPPAGDFTGMIEAMATLVQDWTAPHVGVASTGLVSDGHLSPVNPGTLDIPPSLPLRDLLAARLGRTVLVVNDAQAAAWGEYRFGAGDGGASLVFVTVSTGVGGGIVLENRLLRGATGLAGHIGHMVIDPAGPACGCGRRGCLEMLASGRALAATAAARFGRPMLPPALFVRARSDPAARDLLRASAGAVVQALANVRALVDLRLAVVGGGVGLADGYLPLLRQAMEALPPLFAMTIVPARLGADASLIGVADLAAAG